MNPMSWAQATRSAAARTISSQAALASKPWQGRLARPGGFELADAVLDAGVLAVTQFQTGQLSGHLPGGGVGDERGDAHAVDVGEPQLGHAPGQPVDLACPNPTCAAQREAAPRS